jgi:uncharacterized protein (DUF2147 family)
MKAPLIFLLATFLGLPLFAASPVGKWRTIDDASGKTKSIVEISETSDGLLQGRVIEILHSDLGPDPVCEKCPGERKGQPIEGMVILWDMEADGDEWSGGRILDPKKGKVYKCVLRLNSEGHLEVRGFIGFSLIGRTQVWLPVSDE